MEIIIEGNIGSGKTSLLNFLKNEDKDIEIITEPIEKWTNYNGVNLLEGMYKDPLKFAFYLQSYVQLTLIENYLQKKKKPLKLMERSFLSAHFCFVQNMKEQGYIQELQYHLLDDWFNFLMKNLKISPNLIIYIKTTPEVAYERCKKRARNEETTVSFQLFKQLHQRHEEWLVNNDPKIPVYIVDGNLDQEKIKEEYEKIKKHIGILKKQHLKRLFNPFRSRVYKRVRKIANK